MKRRRAFLGLIAATALAGCSGNDGSTEDTPLDTTTPEDTPDPTPEPTPGPTQTGEGTPKETPTETPTPEPSIYIRHPRHEVGIKELTVRGQLENADSPVTVALEVAGQVVETQATNEFEITAEGIPPGEQEYTVATQDDSRTNRADIPEPMEIVEVRDIKGWSHNDNDELRRMYGAANVWRFDPLILDNPHEERYNQDFEVLHDGDVIDTFTIEADDYVGGEEKYYNGPTYEDYPNSAYVHEYQFPWQRIEPFGGEDEITVRSHGTEASGTGYHDQKHPVSWSDGTTPRKQRGVELTGALVDVTTPVIHTHDADEIELVCAFGYFGLDSERGENFIVEKYSIPDTSVEHDVKVKMEDEFRVHPTTLDVNSMAVLNYEPETLPDRGIYDVPDDHFRRVFIRDLEDINREEGHISYTMVVDNLYDAPASVTLMTCPHEYFPEEWPTKEVDIEVSADDDVKRIPFEHNYDLEEVWPNYPGIYILQ